MGGSRPDGLKLYNFVDNHDVERIYTKLSNKNHFTPTHILMYTLPGIPSIYYGSEFGIEGRKERGSDDSLRPALSLEAFADATETNPCTKLITALGKLRQNTPALSYGEYKELRLTNCQYAFARNYNGQSVIIAVNNADNDETMSLPAGNTTEYVGGLSGTRVAVNNGTITVTVKANSGEIWIPASEIKETYDVVMEPVVTEKVEYVPLEEVAEAQPEIISPEPIKKPVPEPTPVTVPNKPYEEMTVEELQAAILERLAKNGPVTEQMKKDVTENVWHDSLINWIKSFR